MPSRRLDDVIPPITVVRPTPAVPVATGGAAAARNGESPLDEVLARRRRASIESIQDVEAQIAEAQLQADLMEARNRFEAAKEEAEARRQAGRGQGENGVLAVLLQWIQQREAQMSTELAGTRSQLQDSLRDEIKGMREAMQQTIAAARPPDLISQAAQMKELYAALRGLMPEPQAVPQGASFEQALALARLQSEERMREAELAMRRASTEAEQRHQEMAIENERMRMAGIAGLVDRYMPQFSSAIVDRVAGRTGTPAAPPPLAANTAPAPPAPPEPTPASCPYCGETTMVPAGVEDFRCSNPACGRELSLHPQDDPHPAAAPSPEPEPAAAEEPTSEEVPVLPSSAGPEHWDVLGLPPTS